MSPTGNRRSGDIFRQFSHHSKSFLAQAVRMSHSQFKHISAFGKIRHFTHVLEATFGSLPQRILSSLASTFNHYISRWRAAFASRSDSFERLGCKLSIDVEIIGICHFPKSLFILFFGVGAGCVQLWAFWLTTLWWKNGQIPSQKPKRL